MGKFELSQMLSFYSEKSSHSLNKVGILQKKIISKLKYLIILLTLFFLVMCFKALITLPVTW